MQVGYTMEDQGVKARVRVWMPGSMIGLLQSSFTLMFLFGCREIEREMDKTNCELNL